MSSGFGDVLRITSRLNHHGANGCIAATGVLLCRGTSRAHPKHIPCPLQTHPTHDQNKRLRTIAPDVRVTCLSSGWFQPWKLQPTGTGAPYKVIQRL